MDYKTIVTGDGSPTLSLAPTWELMHADEGAFSERQYIYQPTVAGAFEAVARPVFLSLGLGLGYNEMLIAFEALERGRFPERIVSYESVEQLKESFTAWLRNEPALLSGEYDQIAGLYSRKYRREAGEAKVLLRKLMEADGFRLLGALESEEPQPSHAILFDAFSRKTSPELWTPDFLNRFFRQASARPCFFSTHACNGDLKRALAMNGFTLDVRKGFGRKRESAFARRPA